VTNPTAEQIYAHVQAELRKTTDINDGDVVVEQTVQSRLVKLFLRSCVSLVTICMLLGQTVNSEGVFIDDYNDTDVNRLPSGVTQTAELVAQNTLTFNSHSLLF